MRRSGPSLSRLARPAPDRKSTRLNSSHVEISYAVFCLKKKNRTLEVFDMMGIIDEFLAQGRQINAINAHSERQKISRIAFDRLDSIFSFFFFNDTATTEIYTLSLHDALPI